MTRVFVDTRPCWGWREAANMAGALDLDVVALVADNGPSQNALKRIKRKLRKVGQVSKEYCLERAAGRPPAARCVQCFLRFMDWNHLFQKGLNLS